MEQFEQYHRWLLDLSRGTKRRILIAGDVLGLMLVFFLAYAVRTGALWPTISPWWLLLLAPLLTMPALRLMGFYQGMVRYSGRDSVVLSLLAMTLGTALMAGVMAFMGWKGVPRSVLFIYWALGLLYLTGSRLALRGYLNWAIHGRRPLTAVAIYGAGYSGIELMTALKRGYKFDPVVFVDDRSSLHGSRIEGVPVLSPQALSSWVERGRVRTVLLAMPSATRAQRLRIISFLETLPVTVKSVPALGDIVAGVARIEQVQDVAIEDLLGRDPVPPRAELLTTCITGKNVLVTGAGGSIGSELCRQIMQCNPRRLVLVEHSEFGLYSMEQELRQMLGGRRIEIVPILGSVVNRGLLVDVCRQYRIHTLYHAAAYKHVPIVEHNPSAGVRNNILGTFTAAEAADVAGVERFILISTDKAVRPTNVMGATKRFSELILQAMAARGSETVFSMVRFGNVLGSSGSVVPLFRKQIDKGGPVTVTHADVTRYFMTIPEASQLVIQAGAMARGGEVFVLDMGEPVRIYDLACTMIRLMGRRVKDERCPEGDIEIKVTGLRPGEKLYEELLFNDDGVGTDHPMIMQAREEHFSWEQISAALDEFRVALDHNDTVAMRALLRRFVAGYVPGASGEPMPQHKEGSSLDGAVLH